MFAIISLKFQESSVAVHWLSLVGLRLADTKGLQLLFRVILLINSLRPRFIIISLHPIDFLFSLLTYLYLIDRL